MLAVSLGSPADGIDANKTVAGNDGRGAGYDGNVVANKKVPRIKEALMEIELRKH